MSGHDQTARIIVSMIVGAHLDGSPLVADLTYFQNVVAEQPDVDERGLRLHLVLDIRAEADTLGGDAKTVRFDASHGVLTVAKIIAGSSPAERSTALIEATLNEAISAASAYVLRRKLDLTTAPLKEFVARITSVLPNSPLPERQRYVTMRGGVSDSKYIRSFVEFGGNGAELRRIDVYENGIDYAVRAVRTGATWLRHAGDRKPDHIVGWIPRAEFEERWREATARPATRGALVVDATVV